MDVSDFLCHICLGVLVEPVTMPCSHRICQVCLLRSIEVNRTCCPLCKRRLGVWCRRRANGEGLVDRPLWEEIQRRFPAQVQAKMAEQDQEGVGSEASAEALEELFPCVPTHDHARQGEVGSEFRREQDRVRREEEDRRRKEEELSMELIRKMQREEEAENSPPGANTRKRATAANSPFVLAKTSSSSAKASLLSPPSSSARRGEKRKREAASPTAEKQEEESGTPKTVVATSTPTSVTSISAAPTATATSKEESGDPEKDDPGEGPSGASSSCSYSPEEVREQRRVLEEIRQLRADGEMARRLQREAEEEEEERAARVRRTPSTPKTMSATPKPLSKKSKSAEVGGSGKKFRQLSINELLKR